MEGSKRLGVALLVLVAALACFANQSSARGHPDLNLLARVMNKENAATATCDFCICLRTWPPKCYCRDVLDSCPSSCEKCDERDGKYVCNDLIKPSQCKPLLISSLDANQMIKLAHGHE